MMNIDFNPKRTHQRGAAIIMAMLIMALATVIISGLFWRQHVTIRSIENRLALSQTRWIERAAVDWARVIMRSDAALDDVDHLGEVWALPVAETKMDETVTAGAKIDTSATNASLSGQIIDAHSRFNLNNLLLADGRANTVEVESFRRLLVNLSLPAGLVEPLLAYQLQTRSKTFDGNSVPATNLPLKRVSDLARIEGFDPRVINALDGQVFVLPVGSKVNINTASAEVISALLDVDLSSAKGFVARRERKIFKSISQATSEFPLAQTLAENRWSVSSSYFIVRGNVKYDRVAARSDTLIERKKVQNKLPTVDVLWQDRY
jgi:general secretion pathway protein K